MLKNCQHCQKEFEAKREDKKFCSGSCRAKYSLAQKKTLSGEFPLFNPPQVTTAPPPPSPIFAPKPKSTVAPKSDMPNLDIQAKFVINSLEKESERWEKAYNETLRENKELVKKLEEQKEKLREIENEQRIAEIQGNAKSSLEGLTENPVFQQLVGFLGPALEKGSMKLVEWVSNERQNAPAVNGLPTTENNQAAAFLNWINTQSPNVQKSIFEMLQALSQTGTENEILMKLGTIERLAFGQYMKAV